MDKIERQMVKRAVGGVFLAWLAVAVGGFLALAMGGCAGGPVGLIGPTVEMQQAGFQIAWEGALRMEREAQPTIEWYDGTSCTTTEWQGTKIVVPGFCQESIIDSDGHARVAWVDGASLSTTDFAVVLAKWRGYLLSGTLSATQIELNEERAVRIALATSGY